MIPFAQTHWIEPRLAKDMMKFFIKTWTQRSVESTIEHAYVVILNDYVDKLAEYAYRRIRDAR